jgi:hypothetical protein
MATEDLGKENYCNRSIKRAFGPHRTAGIIDRVLKSTADQLDRLGSRAYDLYSFVRCRDLPKTPPKICLS